MLARAWRFKSSRSHHHMLYKEAPAPRGPVVPMEYNKYKLKSGIGQIFKPNLPVPKEVREAVYKNSLSFDDYIKYDLVDKVPTSVLQQDDHKKMDRFLVEKFGVEKVKNLDWEFLNKLGDYKFKKVLEKMDGNSADINKSLYQVALDEVGLEERQITDGFVKHFPWLAELENMEGKEGDEATEASIKNRNIKNISLDYHKGKLSLYQITENWDLLKDKDLSNNSGQTVQVGGETLTITEQNIKDLMTQHHDIYKLFDKRRETNGENIFKYIQSDNTVEKNVMMREFVAPLSKNLSNQEYATLSKYVFFDDILNKWDNINKEEVKIMFESNHQEKSTHAKDEICCKSHNHVLTKWIAEMPIQLTELLATPNHTARYVFGEYGARAILDFCRENGNNLFDSVEKLDHLFEEYMHYDHNREVKVKKRTDEEKDKPYEQFSDRAYTKEEFYKSMRNICKKPLRLRESENKDHIVNYSELKGPFRDENPDLFLDDNAPQPLKDLFYTKQMSMEQMGANPEWKKFLKGKHLALADGWLCVANDRSNESMELQQYLAQKTDDVAGFIADYADALANITRYRQYRYEPLHISDDIQTIKQKVDEELYKYAINEKIPYSKESSPTFAKNHPGLFIDENAPQELKDAFYNRTKDVHELLQNPEYFKYIKDTDYEVLYPQMSQKVPVSFFRPEEGFKDVENFDKNNLVRIIRQSFGAENGLQFLSQYGKYLEQLNMKDKNYNELGVNSVVSHLGTGNLSEENLRKTIEEVIYKNMVKGTIKYDDKMPQEFKAKYPRLFLPDNAPQDVKDKFYAQGYTASEFENNPELLKHFDNTDVSFALGSKYNFARGILDGEKSNQKILAITKQFDKIGDATLEKCFGDFVNEKRDDFAKQDISNIEKYCSDVSTLLSRLAHSNASEMRRFKETIAQSLLRQDDPLKALDNVEAVFLKNNLPTAGKIFNSFKLLYPDYEDLIKRYSSTVSPVLKQAFSREREFTISADLIKCAIGSNNRSMGAYLENLEKGNQLLQQISTQQGSTSDLGDNDKETLEKYVSHLNTLYNNTYQGKKGANHNELSGDVTKDANRMIELFSTNGKLDYDLSDRVVRMFCGYAGINTLEQAKQIFDEKRESADKRGRRIERQGGINLEQGDLVKGLGDIKYLGNILQNGSVSKEFLGSDATSDATPLDTDLSKVLSVKDGIGSTIERTQAGTYGGNNKLFAVLKNDDRFNTTRCGPNENIDIAQKPDPSKYELFYTGHLGEDHYGIRTGFASTDIDSFVTTANSYNPVIGFEIAKNGFYIPVVDGDGKIVYSSKEYDNLRDKMAGLTQYGTQEYKLGDLSFSPEVNEIAERIKAARADSKTKNDIIEQTISKVLEKHGLQLKTQMDKDLTTGSVEFINTGSTGRDTNMIGDGDYDFIMRLDNNIIANSEKMSAIKKDLASAIGKQDTGGDFRFEDVKIDGIETPIDMDISFDGKSDKVSFTTDVALKERLENIKKQHPEEYPKVLANILMAKKMLKDAEAYKPKHAGGGKEQGGLGGVGIENWILQNGGSLKDAISGFLSAAEGKSFEEFQKNYQVWDFGENHLAERNGKYPHDNFVNNMDAQGYEKTVEACKAKLNEIMHQKQAHSKDGAITNRESS